MLWMTYNISWCFCAISFIIDFAKILALKSKAHLALVEVLFVNTNDNVSLFLILVIVLDRGPVLLMVIALSESILTNVLIKRLPSCCSNLDVAFFYFLILQEVDWIVLIRSDLILLRWLLWGGRIIRLWFIYELNSYFLLLLILLSYRNNISIF